MSAADRIAELAETFTTAEAAEIVGDPKQIGEYADDLQGTYLPPLCRALRSLPNARRELAKLYSMNVRTIALEAITTALSELERDLIAEVIRSESVRDRANDAARQSVHNLGSLA